MTQHSKLLASRRKKQSAENKRRIDLKNFQARPGKPPSRRFPELPGRLRHGLHIAITAETPTPAAEGSLSCEAGEGQGGGKSGQTLPNTWQAATPATAPAA